MKKETDGLSAVHRGFSRFFPVAAATAAVFALAGCSTPVLRLSMNEPGEFKLTDISKIAVLDFNSLPGDSFAGGEAADAETCTLVQRAVCAAFAKARAWDVARLDAERAVAHFDGGVFPSRRFDAIAYGRVWWQYPPERDVMKPKLFTLETKTRVAYTVPASSSSGAGSLGSLGSSLGSLGSSLGSLGSSLGALGGKTGSSAAASKPALSSGQTAPSSQSATKMLEKHVDLVTETRDVLEKVGHRSREATLMLALAVYRLRADGRIEKLADTIVVLDDGFSFDNGEFSSAPRSFGAVAAPEAARQDGTTVLPENSSTIPDDLQAKLMLVSRAAADVARRLAPHKTVRTVSRSFSDDKLLNLLRNAAYGAAETYALRFVRSTLGAEVAAEVLPLQAYDPPEEPLPPSDPDDVEAVSVADKSAAAEAAGRIAADRDCAEALFALAVCQEATGRAEQALYTYRYVFDIEPDPSSAEGIARCREELGAEARMAEQARSVRKAGARASLE